MLKKELKSDQKLLKAVTTHHQIETVIFVNYSLVSGQLCTTSARCAQRCERSIIKENFHFTFIKKYKKYKK